VLTQPQQIEQHIRADALAVYRAHTQPPWLHHLFIGEPDAWCHVMYRRERFKALPCAVLLYMSDPLLFDRHFRQLSGHFLRRGMVTTLVECRYLSRVPAPSKIRSGFSPKMYLSETLPESDINYLCSEIMAFDF
jgi:hypothetical protein